YELPEDRIAQQPLADRAASRMLHLVRPCEDPSGEETGEVRDCSFRDFPALLQPDDLLVMNNTRVFPARLYARRAGIRAQPLSPRNPASHEFLRGRMEVLLTRQGAAEPPEWDALVRPGRKLGVGERLFFYDESRLDAPAALEAEIMGRGEFGERTLRFKPVP